MVAKTNSNTPVGTIAGVKQNTILTATAAIEVLVSSRVTKEKEEALARLQAGERLRQLAAELEADHLRQEHRDGLAEHRRLGLDAADAPADDADAVDHRRVAVGADDGVGWRERRGHCGDRFRLRMPTLLLWGDADRLIVVDEKGRLIDGDQLMAVIAESLRVHVPERCAVAITSPIVSAVPEGASTLRLWCPSKISMSKSSSSVFATRLVSAATTLDSDGPIRRSRESIEASASFRSLETTRNERLNIFARRATGAVSPMRILRLALPIFRKVYTNRDCRISSKL